MMNHSKIVTLWLKNSFLILLSVSCSFANAQNLFFKVKGNRITYSNATVSDTSSFTPTFWFPVPNLFPTKEWIPTFTLQQSDVTFSNGFDSFVQPVEITEVTFKSSGFDSSIFSEFSAPTCETNSNGPTIITIGSNSATPCINSYKFSRESGEEIVPFRYFKPKVNLDGLLDNLKIYGEGRYFGSMPFNLRYYYRTSAGVLSYRVIQSSLSIEVDYEPSIIYDVIVSGSNAITPSYDKVSKKVSGSTVYDITVKGIFSDGVKMSFVNDSEDDIFELSNDFSEHSIPYSISCSLCVDRDVVINGVLTNSEGISKIDVSTDFSFALTVSYKDIRGHSLVSGGYHDTFFIYFEPDI